MSYKMYKTHSSCSKDSPQRQSDFSEGSKSTGISSARSTIQAYPSEEPTGISSTEIIHCLSRKRDRLQSLIDGEKSKNLLRRHIPLQELPVELHVLELIDPDSVPVRIVRVDMVLDASLNNADFPAAIGAFRTTMEECQLLKIGRFHGETLTKSTSFDDDAERYAEAKVCLNNASTSSPRRTQEKQIKRLRSTIGVLAIPHGITTIPRTAFSGCTRLTTVLISDSVLTIDEGAFEGCIGLTDVVIPNSVITIGDCAFKECIGLVDVFIPESVITIGDFAFWGCTGLSKVGIPDLATIGVHAFPAGITLRARSSEMRSRNLTPNKSTAAPMTQEEQMKTLERLRPTFGVLVIPYGITTIPKDAFSNCVRLTTVLISDSVITIENNAFRGCTNLTAALIPHSVVTIGAYAFSVCSHLTAVVIPNSVITIGEGAFCECTGLTAVVISNSISRIRCKTFDECRRLTTMVIPESVATIGANSFRSCKRLISVIIPDSVTKIGKAAFCGCRSLTVVVIPNSVITIDAMAFAGCKRLTSVVLPESLRTISPGTFNECTGLTTVELQDSVRTIGRLAFAGCTGLASVEIPVSVITIEDFAFYRCTGLTEVVVPDRATIGDDAFPDEVTLTLSSEVVEIHPLK